MAVFPCGCDKAKTKCSQCGECRECGCLCDRVNAYRGRLSPARIEKLKAGEEVLVLCYLEAREGRVGREVPVLIKNAGC